MTDTVLWSHKIRLPAVPVSASRARAFVYRHLVEHRLAHLADSVRLVASELVTNAILHADTPFTVTLSACGNGVLLGVHEEPAGEPVSEPAAAPIPDLLGRSLLIVELLSRHSGVTTDRQGSRTVWAYLDRTTGRGGVG